MCVATPYFFAMRRYFSASSARTPPGLTEKLGPDVSIVFEPIFSSRKRSS